MVDLAEQLDVGAVYKKLEHPSSDAVCVFVSMVRKLSEQGSVRALEFEAFDLMALNQMRLIAIEAGERWKLNKVVLEHVKGYKEVSEAVVIAGVSAVHRKESFQGCQYLIDTLKERVPIWIFFLNSDTI